jgi:predicted dithiol-disulfide oxidoreductase (DUF899 family)
MTKHEVVSEEKWIEARRVILAEEKAFTRERDRLSIKRRALPWVKVKKNYVFRGIDGTVMLGDLFDGRSQLAVSLGPIEKLEAYRRRMGWKFPWVSSAAGDFNLDYHVSFPKGTRERGEERR